MGIFIEDPPPPFYGWRGHFRGKRGPPHRLFMVRWGIWESKGTPLLYIVEVRRGRFSGKGDLLFEVGWGRFSGRRDLFTETSNPPPPKK